MAYTAIADLVKNDAFTRYFTKALLDRSALFKSGIAVADPFIQQKCNEAGFGGEFVSLPFFNALATGAGHTEEILNETDLTPDKVTSGKDVAVICRRGKAFGANDIRCDVVVDLNVVRISGGNLVGDFLRVKRHILKRGYRRLFLRRGHCANLQLLSKT